MSDTVGDQINSTVTYYPFGTTRSGSIPTDRLYTGQRLDQTGIYFYNARYYEPGIGKFLSPDSASPDLYNPQSLNKYSYCFNNPLKYNDPSGKWPNWGNIGKAISKGFQTAVNVVKENMDVVHTVLDVAGMIPGVGEAFDAVNGLIYAAEGDVANAALSFAACIPVVGTAATGVKLVGKTIDKVAGVVKAADKVGDSAEILYHYTNATKKQVIGSGKGLISKTGKIWSTPDGMLSPTQAKQLLALPDPVPPKHLFGIDVGAMRRAGYDIPSSTTVKGAYDSAGNWMAGGGLESVFNLYQIDPKFLMYIR